MSKRVFVQGALVFCAAYYTIIGIMLFVVPQFFFTHFGHIGAYNPHYARDAGSFAFALGLILFFISRDPVRYSMIAVFIAIASALHVLSHVLEGIHSTGDALRILFLAAVTAFLLLPVREQYLEPLKGNRSCE